MKRAITLDKFKVKVRAFAVKNYGGLKPWCVFYGKPGNTLTRCMAGALSFPDWVIDEMGYERVEPVVPDVKYRLLAEVIEEEEK